MRTFTAILIGVLISAPFSSFAVAGDGKTSYEKRCIACHGTDGRGSESAAKFREIDVSRMDLTAERNVKRSEADLMKIVRKGKEKMRAISVATLSDDDLKAIIAYVRTLQKNKK